MFFLRAWKKLLVCFFRFFFLSLPLPASQGPRPIRPRGDDLCCHLLPLFLRARPEDCSTGGNPPQASHVDFPFILGQHLRHVPILRMPHITLGAYAVKSGGLQGPTRQTEQYWGPALLPFYSDTNTLTHTHTPSQPAWETPITVSVGLVANRAGRDLLGYAVGKLRRQLTD